MQSLVEKACSENESTEAENGPIVVIDDDMAKAATKIQASFRGRMARQNTQKKKKPKGVNRVSACRGYTINSHESILKYYEMNQKSKLGEGSFGCVTTCRCKVSAHEYAVKTIAKSQVKDQAAMRKEIQMMQELDHPNMIKLFATFEDSRFFYLVMEICSGGELLDRIIKDGHFTESKAAIVMSQIFRACHYLHNTVQLCHRDIKLENFLLSSKDEISVNNYLKMIDFGESKELTGEPLTTRVGTPFYVAPEVLNAKYDQKADMWSCGVCAYMLLAGYPPFPGTTPNEVTANVITGQYEFHAEAWDSISGDAQDLISKLLCYNPQERLDARQALDHAWVVSSAPKAQLRRGQTQGNLLGNLKSFQSKNQLQKLAMNAVARSLNEKEIEELKNLFVALDENGDGQLTIEELQAGMGQCGLAEAASKLSSIIAECDADGDGVIAYTEFLAATVDRRKVIQEDVCWQAFRVFDMDGSGTIDKTELSKVLESEEVQEVLGIDSASLKEILSEVDKNGDGEIDFDEFMTMMRAGTV
jgi:calcium-dependent protein kinase